MNEIIIAGDDEVDLGSKSMSLRGSVATAAISDDKTGDINRSRRRFVTCSSHSKPQDGVVNPVLRYRQYFLSGLIVIAAIGIGFQQWPRAFEWKSAVAHADDSSQVENLCALKKSFAQSLDEQSLQVSLLEDEACTAKQEVSHDQAVSTTPLAQELTDMVLAYPIATMTKAIAAQDRTVAAFLIGIAKKESDWGKHVPQKEGKDCYNYWGYKGAGVRGTAQGYACFATPEEAVRVVGGRLATLALTQHKDTPAKMIVWKCGSSCAGHSPESVRSWIGNVDTYYKKIVTHTRG